MLTASQAVKFQQVMLRICEHYPRPTPETMADILVEEMGPEAAVTVLEGAANSAAQSGDDKERGFWTIALCWARGLAEEVGE